MAKFASESRGREPPLVAVGDGIVGGLGGFERRIEIPKRVLRLGFELVRSTLVPGGGRLGQPLQHLVRIAVAPGEERLKKRQLGGLAAARDRRIDKGLNLPEPVTALEDQAEVVNRLGMCGMVPKDVALGALGFLVAHQHPEQPGTAKPQLKVRWPLRKRGLGRFKIGTVKRLGPVGERTGGLCSFGAQPP